MRTEIDFLSEDDKVKNHAKKKMPLIGKLIIYPAILIGAIGIFLGTGIISSSEQLSKAFGNIGLFGQVKQLISNDEKKLVGEDDDRINILLLGMGGVSHDGPYLTDTIMVASLKPSTNQVALISIPRDLLVEIPGFGWRKINHANAFGEGPDSSGGELARQVVSEVLDLEIPYYARIDFNGFITIIDQLGGITVNVENTLEDPFYPVKGKETATTTERYEHLYIEAGEQKFDGETALKFVRSRQGYGIEGSDFARGQRQQQVILAVKDKALSLRTLANPVKTTRLMNTLSDHFSTNMKIWEIVELYQKSKDINQDSITHQIFDDSPDGQLYATIAETGAFVLMPKAGDFSELQMIAKHIFNPNEIVRKRPRRVEVQNGTNVTGLASRTSDRLTSNGHKVVTFGNAPTRDYQKSVVYAITHEAETEQTAAKIAELLNASYSTVAPQWIHSTTTPLIHSQTEILVIVGQDNK